jgi:hypothetical protein
VTVTVFLVRPNWFVDSSVEVVVVTGAVPTTVVPRTGPTSGVLMLYSEPLTLQHSVTTCPGMGVVGFAVKVAISGGTQWARLPA